MRAALHVVTQKSVRHETMHGGTSGVVLKDLHTLFQVGTAGGLTDGQLIERFLSQRDDAGEAAFRALVERHAPMVLRICRDILGDWHEAEDASQATFIVLARKSGSIQKRDSIVSWLFGVACRVAAKAKAKAARHRRHEERSAALAAGTIVLDDSRVPWLELYEEIDRLPEHLRGPLVLCYLKGHSQREAAARLGCPVRTLQNHLARGRERLRSRLARQGLSPAFGSWEASIGSGGASAPMPGCLVGEDRSGRSGQRPSHIDRRDGLGLGCRTHRGDAHDDVSHEVEVDRGGGTGDRRGDRWNGPARDLGGGSPAAGGTGRRDRKDGAHVSRERRSSSGPLISRKTAGTKGSRGSLPSTQRQGNGGRSTRGSR